MFLWLSLLSIWWVRLFIRSTFFLYGQLFNFYTVNFLLFIRSTFYFLYRSVSRADCRFQTADCRPGVKCWLGSKTTRFPGKTLRVSWDRGRVSCERLAIIVMGIDVSNFTSWFWRWHWHVVLEVRTIRNVSVGICSSQLAKHISSIHHLRNKQFCWVTLGYFNIHVAHVYFVWP